MAETYAIHKHRQIIKQKALAEVIFYTMKGLELGVSDTLKEIKLKKDAESQKLIEKY